MRKLRHIYVKSFNQDLTADTWQSWDLNLGSLIPESFSQKSLRKSYCDLDIILSSKSCFRNEK